MLGKDGLNSRRDVGILPYGCDKVGAEVLELVLLLVAQ